MELLNTVDLWFARDSESRNALADAGTEEGAIHMFPDYTTSLQALQSAEYEKFSKRPIIIPNVRMLERKTGGDSLDYFQLIRSLFALLREKFGNPLILAHEMGRDCELVQRLALELKADCVIENRARIVKGIIGKAPVIYSDRLHGIINACSQSVPAFASGVELPKVLAELCEQVSVLSLARFGTQPSAYSCG